MITTPITTSDALQSRRIRRLLPTSASSAELAELAPEILEHSVFSARNIYADVLAEIDTSLQQVMSGDLDQSSMRVAMRKALKATGYDPEAHGITPGSLTDLSSMRRLNLVIDMQTKQAAGYIQFAQANDPLELDLYPCWEFVRHATRIKERSDWPERFVRAGGHLTNGRMIARKDDPVWASLSVFGIPYAPFDYGSGMGLDPVPREECQALGLITSREIPKPQSRDFNKDVVASVSSDISQALRGELESVFGPIIDGQVTLRGAA